jgi:glycerophosphoryl diester phosphodiesterase
VKAAGLEHALIYLLRDLLPTEMWQQTEFTSFNFASAVACQKLLGMLAEINAVGWLTRQWDADAVTTCSSCGLTQLCPPARAVLANPEVIDIAHAAKLAVRVWLVDTPDIVSELDALGVYGGTVNFPGAVHDKLYAK